MLLKKTEFYSRQMKYKVLQGTLRRLIFMKTSGLTYSARTGIFLGFGRIDLLAVISVIAVLSAIILPGLTRAKSKVLGLQCESNNHQLQVGWAMYCSENKDKTVPMDASIGFSSATWATNWVGGTMADSSLCTNTLTITTGLLWKYVGNLKFYRCPADWSLQYLSSTSKNVGAPRGRSMSYSQVFSYGDWLPMTTYRTYTSQSQIVKPAETWVFMDEDPYSINDSGFALQMYSSGNPFIVDVPAGYHGQACGISFSDGHSIIHKWQSRKTCNPYNGQSGDFTITGDASCVLDMTWLSSMTTVKR
jgi:hypothetical protein